MNAKKVLFITQEITPYVPESEMSKMGRYLPQAVQEAGHEIRTFMPNWGCVNERRHQLHEVIRLSGANLIIDDTDHTLIIKVASIQPARMQVYFIDNDEYFEKRLLTTDKDGNEYPDNDERAIFYGRGVLETIKKLRWAPDVIHCQGWMSAFVPLYLKKVYNDEPVFKDSKVVYSMFGSSFKQDFPDNVTDKLVTRNISKDELDEVVDQPVNYAEICKLAVKYSDGVILNSAETDHKAVDYANKLGVPVMPYPGEDNTEAYRDFYEKVCGTGEE